MFYHPRPKMLSLSKIVYHTKNCTKCGQIKTRDEFPPDKIKRTGLHSHCRQCENQAKRELYQMDHVREQKSKRAKKYNQSVHGRQQRSKSQKERYKTDPKFKMKDILRRRLTAALQQAKHGKAVKCARTLDMLGCTMDFFMQYIEQQFEPGMTWQNHGSGERKWQIDHIKPCALFDLTNAEQQKTCFNFSNMQPLWAEDNMKKGCRL